MQVRPLIESVAQVVIPVSFSLLYVTDVLISSFTIVLLFIISVTPVGKLTPWGLVRMILNVSL